MCASNFSKKGRTVRTLRAVLESPPYIVFSLVRSLCLSVCLSLSFGLFVYMEQGGGAGPKPRPRPCLAPSPISPSCDYGAHRPSVIASNLGILLYPDSHTAGFKTLLAHKNSNSKLSGKYDTLPLQPSFSSLLAPFARAPLAPSYQRYSWRSSPRAVPDSRVPPFYM